MFELSGGAVLLCLSYVNMWNYIDRMIVSGAPLQFADFVSSTKHVPEEDTAFWLGCITPAFMITFSVSSIAIGHLAHYFPPFRLLSCMACIWCLALVASGAAYWMPGQPATYWFFICARALSGVGEAAFQCIVPAYVEDFAPPESRAMWLATLYSSIPVGSAIGFGYGTVFASAGGGLAKFVPSHCLGWGWAYLLEAALMLPCAIAMAWLPSANTIRKRRAAKASLTSTPPLLPATANTTSLDAPLMGSIPTPQRLDEPGVESGVPDEGASSEQQPVDPATITVAPAKPSVLSQLSYLLGSPTYMLIALGYAAFTFTVMGISQFAPLALLALGFFETEGASSIIFGAVSAFAGVLGTPLGGYVTDWATKGFSEEVSGTSWPTTLREARALVGAITVMIFIAALLCILAVSSLYLGPSFNIAFLISLCLTVTFSFATSAGISRAVMLVVPVHVRPFALGLNTLILHALGDVLAPLILGLIIGAWSPACSSTVHVPLNTSDPDACPSSSAGGGVKLNPMCSANATTVLAGGHHYSEQQHGLISALLCAAVYMLTASCYWALARMVLTRRMRVEAACPPLRECGGARDCPPRGSVQ